VAAAGLEELMANDWTMGDLAALDQYGQLVTPNDPQWPDPEQDFQRGIRQTPWYSEFKQRHGEEPDLNTPDYDYRRAWAAGVRPVQRDENDGQLHWDSRFKGEAHPNRFVDGVDTVTGQPIDGPQGAQGAFEAFANRTRRSVMPDTGRNEAPGQILGPVVHALGEPIRKGQGLLQSMRDYSANEFPETMGAIAQTTDYDPRREAAGYAAGTALNLVGTPGGTGGLGAGVRLPQRVERMADPPAGGGAAPGVVRASAAEINRAAQESRKGSTQAELRDLYGQLGLTGGEPSQLVKPSLAAQHPPEMIQAAIDLKLADRAELNKLTPKQRQEYAVKGKLPGGALLPSQEAALPALEAFGPLKKEVGKAEKAFDEGVALGVKPSVFDLSPATLKQTPNVDQFNLPRVAPKQTERLEGVSRGGMARLERAAKAAPEENWGWYNLMQQRELAHQLHGPVKGEQVFQTWLDGVAGTSMVNPIDNNIRSSTWYLQQAMQGKPLPQVLHIADPDSGKMVKTMAGGPPPGYGAKSQIQHADRVREYMTNTYDPVTNPKPISYRQNLGGNWMPRTVDTHDIRNMVGMPQAKTLFSAEDSALLPGEYSFLEGVGQRAADRAGTAQAPQQAATWVGGGKYTGLKSYPAPLQEAINRRAHVTAQVRGISPMQALEDAFKGKAPLLGYGGGAAVLGGLAAQDEYGR
jgi:hypothetical protein